MHRWQRTKRNVIGKCLLCYCVSYTVHYA